MSQIARIQKKQGALETTPRITPKNQMKTIYILAPMEGDKIFYFVGLHKNNKNTKMFKLFLLLLNVRRRKFIKSHETL